MDGASALVLKYQVVELNQVRYLEDAKLNHNRDTHLKVFTIIFVFP